MAGLFLAREEVAPAATAAARQAFARQGFGAPVERAVPGWRLLHWPYLLGGPATFREDGADWIALAGTLRYRGQVGGAALAALLAQADPPRFDRGALGGQFVAVMHKRGRTFLLTDDFAGFPLFHDVDRTIFATSLLAATQALPRVRFDAQGVYEFAFNVMPIGDDTVFAELKTLAPGVVLELGARVTAHPCPRPLPRAERLPLGEHLARNRAALEHVVGAFVAAAGDAIHAPLTGGLDSRLLLAALRAAGSRPHVYIYGPPGSEDVRIAQAIGAAEGFPVEWIEKGREPIAPDAFADQVAANFHAFDGLPTYGAIFDNGGHLRARDARHAGGALAASGGCGEIYRDFFFLPDRPASARDVARAFYSRFLRSDATEAFDPRSFMEAIAAKIALALGTASPAERLPRDVIEHAYPTVRCRAVFGREIALEARCGPYLMPFLDAAVVRAAMALPVREKRAGAFEAMLLAAIDPALARHMSAYGHDFAGPPGWRHRLSEASTRHRPLALRARSYALKRRLRPMADEHGGLLAPGYMGRVIDLEFPAMRRFFHVDRIADSGLWQRIACLEYLAGWLGTRLAD